jgi:hypothetical protein
VWTLVVLLVGSAFGMMGASPARHPPSSGECSTQSGGASFCIYRSLAPSAGIVASCHDERDCRVGYYYGNPTDAVWLAPPTGMTMLPRPEVIWLTATLAQVRFDCVHPCSVSYFFEVRRHRLSEPRYAVLAVDPRRLLIAVAEQHALVVRQAFSGREVARLERDWAPAAWLGDVIVALAFDPDGRLSFTWLRGKERVPVNERVSVPSVPHS